MKDINIVRGTLKIREERELACASFEYIQKDIYDIKNQYMRLGFHLNEVQQMKYFEDFGYHDFYEFCEKNFKMDKSAVSRCMSVWWNFSSVQNQIHCMWVDKRYEKYNYSQLCELLPLSDQQREQVKPDMSVKQIREMKKDWKTRSEVTVHCYDENKKVLVATSQQKSAYKTEAVVRNEESLIRVKGCEGGHDCFSCHVLECEIRQEGCYCVTAPLGNPFPCTVLNVVENLKNEIGTDCKFVNLQLAVHRTGDNEPVPCCLGCKNPCGYECRVSVDKRYKKEHAVSSKDMLKPDEAYKIENNFTLQREIEHFIADDLSIDNAYGATISAVVKRYLETGYKEECNNCKLEVWGQLYEVIRREDIAEFYGSDHRILFDIENARLEREYQFFFGKDITSPIYAEDNSLETQQSQIQTEFPVLKNMQEREDFINSYKNWNIWCKYNETEDVFYKYDLPDGAAIVVKNYPMYIEWKKEEAEGSEYFLLKKGYKHFMNCKSSITELKEYLKNLNKNK